MILKSKFIESKGYWYSLVKASDNDFVVQNTRRRRNQVDRDGIEYIIKSFTNEKDAMNYLENQR